MRDFTVCGQNQRPGVAFFCTELRLGLDYHRPREAAWRGLALQEAQVQLESTKTTDNVIQVHANICQASLRVLSRRGGLLLVTGIAVGPTHPCATQSLSITAPLPPQEISQNSENSQIFLTHDPSLSFTKKEFQ